jgi:hypothetical protein
LILSSFFDIIAGVPVMKQGLRKAILYKKFLNRGKRGDVRLTWQI